MIARNEIYWADLGHPSGRRPVCAVTRNAVHVGPEEGLPDRSVVNCDNLITIPISILDSRPVGRLSEIKRAQLDRALRYALDIIY